MADHTNDTAVGNDTRHDEDAENPKPSPKANEESAPKQKKLIRFLTVMAYMMSVSMIAISLSLYYIFLWNPKAPKTYALMDNCPLCYPSPKLLNYSDFKTVAEESAAFRTLLPENLASSTYLSNHSTSIPEKHRIETPQSHLSNIISTTSMTETTTEFNEDEYPDINSTTPFSPITGSS